MRDRLAHPAQVLQEKKTTISIDDLIKSQLVTAGFEIVVVLALTSS
jgi:hypothetical protein